MQSTPDPAERPEGLEIRPPSRLPDIPEAGPDRPDWLVGSDDVLEASREQDGPRRPTIADAPSPGPLRLVEGGKPATPTGTPSTPKGWSGAASSVPKLSVVAAAERPPSSFDDSEAAEVPDAEDPEARSDVDGADLAAPRTAEPAFRPLNEPWHLVLVETLLTNRKLQVGLLLVAVAIATFTLWPRSGAQGASLGSILSHPERYEGKPVVVRGEVLESFAVGLGHAFQLRQGRNVVVVYSTLREPRLHERVEVKGTVSTGYLDGAPRVAIFEGAAP